MNCAEPEETERRTELPAEAAKYTSACLLASKREFRTYTLAILSCPAGSYESVHETTVGGRRPSMVGLQHHWASAQTQLGVSNSVVSDRRPEGRHSRGMLVVALKKQHTWPVKSPHSGSQGAGSSAG